VKVGLLSDIHCKLPGLLQALEQLDDCDELLCAGDLVYQYRFSNDVLATLKRRGVRSILGNHDKIVLHTPNHPLRASASVDPAWLAYLASLPNSLALTLGGVHLQMFHGSPWDDDDGRVTPYIYPQSSAELRRLAEFAADVIVLGHTHVPFVHDTGRALVVNPGSCAEPRDGTLMPCCAVLDTDSRRVDFRRYALTAGDGTP
jgi:putative phosphoesterase